MTDLRNGRRFRVPASRHLSWDLLAFHRSIPLCPHDRHMHLGPLNAARQQSPIRISWPALFLKAGALVAREVPELRQIWYRWPWAHLYQHPESIGILTVQREWQNERWLFWGRIPSPDGLTLPEIQRRIDWFRDGDVRDVFRKQVRFARLPFLLRRLVWWWNLNVATKQRATRLGTFFLSTLAGRGAEIQLPPSIQTCCLTFGPLDESASARVTLAYDHRIMDGALVADALHQLEVCLNTALVAELTGLSAADQNTAAA
jgi:hypothetical protein